MGEHVASLHWIRKVPHLITYAAYLYIFVSRSYQKQEGSIFWCPFSTSYQKHEGSIFWCPLSTSYQKQEGSILNNKESKNKRTK